jgi:phage shock protein PspC (stress-responsive transcriptional regulator)
MSSTAEQPGRPRRPVRIVRPRQGRLLGGVCAGLPDLWGLGTNGRRLLFVVAGLLGGVGVVVYLACWLVIPADDHDPDADAVRSVVLLAWATGGLVALVLVAAGAAAATVFGLGWIVFVLATVVTGLSFSPLRRRIPSVAALLTVGALTLPAVAVALSPLRLSFQSGESLVHPHRYRTVDQTVYRSGFGTLLVDLRRTKPLPPDGSATLRIDAGLRRTIVALPTNQCVRVRVNYDINLFPAHFAALLTGRNETAFHDVVLFGRAYGYGTTAGTHATVMNKVNVGAAPLLTIDFTSQGGGLYVRDYPQNVDPDFAPSWPGYVLPPIPKPYLHGEPTKLRKALLRAWKRRRKAQQASNREVKSAMPGACAT